VRPKPVPSPLPDRLDKANLKLWPAGRDKAAAANGTATAGFIANGHAKPAIVKQLRTTIESFGPQSAAAFSPRLGLNTRSAVA
jgi:hypothetical protein